MSSKKPEVWITVVRNAQQLFIMELPGLNILIPPFAHILGEILHPSFESKHPIGINSIKAALVALFSIVPFPNRYFRREFGSWINFLDDPTLEAEPTFRNVSGDLSSSVGGLEHTLTTNARHLQELRQVMLQTSHRPQLKEFFGKIYVDCLGVSQATTEIRLMSVWGLYYLIVDEISAACSHTKEVEEFRTDKIRLALIKVAETPPS